MCVTVINNNKNIFNALSVILRVKLLIPTTFKHLMLPFTHFDTYFSILKQMARLAELKIHTVSVSCHKSNKKNNGQC